MFQKTVYAKKLGPQIATFVSFVFFFSVNLVKYSSRVVVPRSPPEKKRKEKEK
jgi:hypothetical protein